MQPQSYFEMADVISGLYGKSTWTPLWAYEIEKSGDEFTEYYHEEIFRIRTLLAPLENKERLVHAPWRNMDTDQVYACVDKGNYCKPGEYCFDSSNGESAGEYAVFNFYVHGAKQNEPVLNQDLIMALHLVRDGDEWLRPEEANAVVIRQVRKEDAIVRIEILTEVLKDYLCARNMGLYIEEFRHRQEHTSEVVSYPWSSKGTIVERYVENGQYVWKGWLFRQESYNRVEGQLWKQHWVNPACCSSRIWGDEEESIEFIVASDGTRHTISSLDDDRYGAIYLFFDAHIISRLRERNISVEWISRDVLDVSFTGHSAVRCGLSKNGHVFAIAADIARLELWAQRIWERENINPEDRSEYQGHELFRNQMCNEFLSGEAPEVRLPLVLNKLNDVFKKRVGFDLWKKIDEYENPVCKSSRLISVDEHGLLTLAKYLQKSLCERIDSAVLKRYINNDATTKELPSIEVLEKAIEKIDPSLDASSLVKFMRDINNYRQIDSHYMSKKNVSKKLSRIQLPQNVSYFEKGAWLIEHAILGVETLTKAIY